MANPTVHVPSKLVGYDDTGFLWPLIGGATAAKTYQCGEMIGVRSDGYAQSFDDTADLTFLGIVFGIQTQVDAGDANGAKLIRVQRPYRICMPLDSGTVSRVNFGQRMFAADSGRASTSAGTYANQIGNLVDVLGTSAPAAITGTMAVIQPSSAPNLTGNNLTTGAGAGFTGGTGTIYKNSVELSGGIITSRFLLDLTGLASSTTDLDIIGVSTTPAHIGQITAAQNGTILGGLMTCLEVPVGGITDIDLYWATEGTGVFDGAIASLTETALITAGGAWTLALSKAIADPVGIANGYLYLTGGAAGTAASYTAGKFVLTLFGY